MTDSHLPRHRARVSTRTEPRVQPVRKHAGEYKDERRVLLTATPTIDDIRDWFTLPAGIVR